MKGRKVLISTLVGVSALVLLLILAAGSGRAQGAEGSLSPQDTVHDPNPPYYDYAWSPEANLDDFNRPQAQDTWVKWVNGEHWYDGMKVTVQPSDTIAIADVVNTDKSVTLVEGWNPDHLELKWAGPMPTTPTTREKAECIEGTGVVTCTAPAGTPAVVGFSKIFHVKPGDWSETTHTEILDVGTAMTTKQTEQRSFSFVNLTPTLQIKGPGFVPEIEAGQDVTFTLIYSNNTAGLENGVWVRNWFPPEASFVSSIPTYTQSYTDNLVVDWYIGDLGPGQQGNIDVTVAISDTLPYCTSIIILGGIYDGSGILVDDTVIVFHVGRDVYLPTIQRSSTITP
jgi:hypothetical protein